MKKTIITLAILLVSVASGIKAQAPYKKGIGVNILSLEGVSFKMFFTDNLAFQADLGYKWTVTSETNSGFRISYSVHTLEVNPNILYQKNITDWDFGQLDWFAGGGLSLGYAFGTGYGGYYGRGSAGKFGINAVGGAELSFHNIPLAVQMDFRPGYGLLFNKNSLSYFDWGLNISARYTF
jgi:hypothetical protein